MLDGLLEKLGERLDGLVDPDIDRRIERLTIQRNEYGIDPFGFDPEYARKALPIINFLYRKYFRVVTYGMDQVPPGRVMLISNHSGQLPFDGSMIAGAMFLEADPPRLARGMVEQWSSSLPVFSWFFPRTGQIVGTRENCRILLERDECILIFPEGVKGVNKPFSKRYQLQDFGLGFMRLALMTNTPIVPVAVVGAEEQTVNLFNFMALARLVKAPALPITPTMPLLGPLSMMPLPTRYHIHFGAPLHFEGNPDDEDGAIARQVRQVKGTIQRMLNDGRKARKHVFW